MDSPNAPVNGDSDLSVTHNQPPPAERLQPETPETEDQFWNNNSDVIESHFDMNPRPRRRIFLRLTGTGNMRNNSSESSSANEEQYTISRDATCKGNRLPVTLIRSQAQPSSPEPPPTGPASGTSNAYASLRIIELPKELPSQDSQRLVVFPRLRPFKVERIRSVGEAVTFLEHICEVIQFMHNYNVAAHTEWTAKNIVAGSFGMDLNGPGSDPTSISRIRVLRSRVIWTLRTLRYYFISTGTSPNTAPRHASEGHCDACGSHIARLGDLVFEHLMQVFSDERYKSTMSDLVESMRRNHADQAQRQHPGISEVMGTLERIRFQHNAAPTRASLCIANFVKGMKRRPSITGP